MKTVVAASCAALLAAGLAARADEKVWRFDADRVGAIAKGFNNEVGHWKVVTDESAPSKPTVLAQMAGNSGSTFNLMLIAGTNHKTWT